MREPLYPTLLSEHIGLTGTYISMRPVAIANSFDWMQPIGIVDEVAREKAFMNQWAKEIEETE